MKNFVKTLSFCALLGFAATPAYAANSAPSANTAQTATYSQNTVTKRRIVRRVEHKYVASRAAHNKHLVTLTQASQAYGKVFVPTTKQTKAMPNIYRP